MIPEAAVVHRRQAPGLLHLAGRLLYLGVKAQCRVAVAGLDQFSGAPATLVVANHRRDTDVPIIAAALSGFYGPVRRPVLPHFVAREDLFRPGFLGHYLSAWPSALRVPLAAIPIHKIMRTLQAYPMRRIPERSLREVLEDLLDTQGNRPVAELLCPSWARRFDQLAPAGAAPLMLDEILADRYDSLLNAGYGLRKLAPSAFRQICQAERETIAGHLDHFIRLLEQGEIVQIEPEGRLSRDGRLGRLRGALHILLNKPKADLRMLPVAVTYDSMTRNRPSAFVRFGAETGALCGLGRRETNARVTALLGSLMTLTASQLGGHYLHRLRLEQGVRIDVGDLEEYLLLQTQAFAAAGAPVDPCLLEQGERQARLSDFLDYCRHTGLLEPAGPGQYRFMGPRLPDRIHVDQASDMLGYMANEFAILADTWQAAAV